MKKIYSVSASDIAKAIYGEPTGTEKSIEFGKIAEEILQEALYQSNRIDYVDVLWRETEEIEDIDGLDEDEIVECNFCNNLMVSDNGQYIIDDDSCDCYCFDCYKEKLIDDLNLSNNRILEMFVYLRQMFLYQTIKTPKTIYREIEENKRIYAKGDLYVEDMDIIIEFKTYSKNKYATTQAKVMSWVYQKPVLLICFSFNENGKMKIQKKIIKPPEKIRLPKNLEWKEQEIVEDENENEYDDYDYDEYDFDDGD